MARNALKCLQFADWHTDVLAGCSTFTENRVRTREREWKTQTEWERMRNATIEVQRMISNTEGDVANFYEVRLNIHQISQSDDIHRLHLFNHLACLFRLNLSTSDFSSPLIMIINPKRSAYSIPAQDQGIQELRL